MLREVENKKRQKGEDQVTNTATDTNDRGRQSNVKDGLHSSGRQCSKNLKGIQD